MDCEFLESFKLMDVRSYKTGVFIKLLPVGVLTCG